jgi:chromosome segregation ATPase
MESALSAEQCLKEELILAKDELAAKLQTMEATLTAECDKLRTELSAANVQLEASYRSCVDLEQFLASEKNEKDLILKEKETLSCQLVDLGEVMETMNSEIKEKDDSIVAIQVQMIRPI